jgi:hypothetical protein
VQDIVSNAVYACQACGKEAHRDLCPHDDPEAFEESGWELKGVKLCDQILVLMTCPRCSRYEASWVLEAYKDRISSGLDLGFH